ncbi:hypothetical protein [Brevundimonas sp.]|uniref:hypothetical protein n=1 Tax=Brevundimonas sp. TaxID=1871086 RepID=UPI002897324A|nr:hypothetical protein [Brevundimonas sp.]
MTQTPTDALRLVPVPYVVLSEAAGLLDCEGYGPLALTLNNLLAAAPASPLPEAGQLSKNLGQLKSGQSSGIPGELNPELFAENAKKSEGWQDMTCDEQFALATEIAANIGYVLQPEPDHPDCPHTRQGMTKILREQLNDKSRRLRPLPAAPSGGPA